MCEDFCLGTVVQLISSCIVAGGGLLVIFNEWSPMAEHAVIYEAFDDPFIAKHRPSVFHGNLNSHGL